MSFQTLSKDSGLISQLEKEITQYLTEEVQVSENYSFSQYGLTKRISLFETQTYPTGKFDSQGNYKYWLDVITPRIETEVKNIDFDTKNINVFSPRPIDELPCIVTNLKIDEYLKATGQAEEINSAIEEGSGWGNVVWKKIKASYERVDLSNFFVINQTAKTLNNSPVIERHQMTASILRAKKSTNWDSKGIDETLLDSKTKTYKTTLGTQEQDTTVPYYDIYERNGEISVYDFKRYKEEEPAEGDEDIYILSRVVGSGSKSKGSQAGVTINHILFAEELKGKKMSDIYKEFHRSRYAGRWFRKGIYELLFDIQVRCNQIGNQIAQGLELGAKTILTSGEKLIAQNIMTDMRNGDIIRTKDLKQLVLRMDAFDQLAADWNRQIEIADNLVNSVEIVRGITPTSGTPLGTSQLLNENAGKLHVFIRQKLAIPFSEIFEQWIIPELVKDLKAEEILRITGDSNMLERLHQFIINDWYLQNLIFIPPHTEEIANALKAEKMDELKSRPQLLMDGTKKLFEGFKPHAIVVITGEQINIDATIQTMISFAQLESDPIRRQAIIEKAARMKGMDFDSLDKSKPGEMASVASAVPAAIPDKVKA